MQRDHLVRRVFGRGVDALLDLRARRGAELVAQQRMAEGAGEGAERGIAIELEAAEQHAADAWQLFGGNRRHGVELAAPVGLAVRRDQQRQRAMRGQRGGAQPACPGGGG
ncbi:hypothetical protein D3C81_1533150 [compost metagenome]